MINTATAIDTQAPTMGLYGMSKAGVAYLSQVLGAEAAANGIRVNCVAPGSTPTNFAAHRYPGAVGFEIWNEPDAWNYWGRGLLPIDPVAYTNVLSSAHDAIKSVSPSMPVIGGALAPYPTTVAGVHLSVNDFVGAMLRAGAADDMDGISLHPYPSGAAAIDPGAYPARLSGNTSDE